MALLGLDFDIPKGKLPLIPTVVSKRTFRARYRTPKRLMGALSRIYMGGEQFMGRHVEVPEDANSWITLGQVASPSRGQRLNTNFFFSNFSGTLGISLQTSRAIPPASLLSLDFEGHTELWGPHPFT